MKNQSDSFTRIGWNSALLAALILFTMRSTATTGSDLPKFVLKPLTLPGANGLVMLDYFAYDGLSKGLWVPAGNIGSVDVIDTTTDQIKQVKGFPVAQVELRGKSRPVGPSSVAIGDGVVYVGSDNAVTDGTKGNGQTLFFSCNLLFETFSLRDIAHHGHIEALLFDDHFAQ